MYVGIVLILLGESIVFESLSLLIYAALVWVAFFLTVVGYEEPDLKKRFGATYEEYCKTAPRWLPHRRRSPSKG